MRPFSSACTPRSNSRCVYKRLCDVTVSANFRSRYEFAHARLESKALWKKNQKLDSQKCNCRYLWIIEDSKSVVSLGKKKNNHPTKKQKKPHNVNNKYYVFSCNFQVGFVLCSVERWIQMALTSNWNVQFTKVRGPFPAKCSRALQLLLACLIFLTWYTLPSLLLTLY